MSLSVAYETKKLKSGYVHVIGCDEVGRGCLAGPVVAAAVILKIGKSQDVHHVNRKPWFHEINDSKLLSPQKRQQLNEAIKLYAVGWGIGVVGPKVIDEINIHYASLLAMRRAVEKLWKNVSCESRDMYMCIDGKFAIPSLNVHQEAIIDGDAKILSIAAASIVAKVHRDNLMRDFDTKYPGYNFSQHKGYATLRHRTVLLTRGLSPIHRLSFCGNYTV